MNAKLISTIVGVALAIVSIVSAIGIITSEQAMELTKWIPVVAEAVGAFIAIFTNGKIEAKNVA